MTQQLQNGIQPTDLNYVGPVTGAVIEEAPFEADDVLSRAVSYADLLEVGINPGVAGKIRREYSLVWSFEWVAGADLNRRAKTVGGLDPHQREWIAASPAETPGNSATLVSSAERAWQERANWLDEDTAEPDICERCGDELVTYRLGNRHSVHCESCGYAGIPVRS